MFDSVSLMSIAATIVAGTFVGVVYFGGLWWTVRRLPATRHPWALYLASLAIRSALTLFVFYVVLTDYGMPQLLMLLAAFLLVRLVMAAQLGRTPASHLSEREAA
jgi:F1F0 ATPase subunit 2